MFTKVAKVAKKHDSVLIGTLLLLFLIGLCVRVIYPDLRVFHIDEAIHAWMSYELWMNGTYIYDPKFHGPFLYYLMAAAFSIFGDTDAIVRLIPGIAGACFVPIVYLLYKISYISKNQSLVVALFITISPHLVYFSRFFRHDIFQLLFVFLCIVCIFAYIERKKWYFSLFAGVFAACALCLKEEVPATLCIILSFLGIMVVLGKVKLPKAWMRDSVIAFVAMVSIGYMFYTSLFSHPEIFFNATHMGLNYWLGIQAECRLCGPPYWYISMLVLYELPILVLGIVSAYIWFVRKNGLKRIKDLLSSYLVEVRHHKRFSLPYKPLSKQELFFIFCLYWFILSAFLYGFVNEKVPWLLIHQLLPLVFVASYALEELSKRKIKIAVVLCTLYLCVMMVHVAFIPISDLHEPIVQVQNSEQLRDIMPYIDTAQNVAIVTVQYWPFPWYYRDTGNNNISFYGSWLSPEEIYERGFDLVIAYNSESYLELDGFTKESYQRSYWFNWDEQKERLVEWFFLRNGEVGYDWYDVFRKE